MAQSKTGPKMYKIRRKSDGLFLNITTYPWNPSFDEQGSSWRLPSHLKSAFTSGSLHSSLTKALPKTKDDYAEIEVVEFDVKFTESTKTPFKEFLESGKKKKK